MIMGVVYFVFLRQLSEGYMLWFPIAACFVLGTPFAAILACRDIRKKENKFIGTGFEYFEIANIAAKASAYVHFVAALVFAVIIILLDEPSPDLIDFFAVFGLYIFFGSIPHLILYVFITAPFSHFCAFVFYKCYSAPVPQNELLKQ